MVDVDKKNLVGGSAAEGGLEFQARVSAIVLAHLVAERPLGWLTGVLADVPRQMDAETGGPGDDICFLTQDGLTVEVQAKRGLKRGSDLWEALISLAEGVCNGRIAAGVLAVCPNSSGTVKDDLANDIRRMGTGRSDGLSDIGSDFQRRLTLSMLEVVQACSAIRIVTISAVDGNRESERTACERLTRIAEEPDSIWESLVSYSRKLIQLRGRTSASSLYRELALRGMKVKAISIETQIQRQAAIRRWLEKTHSHLSILGVTRPVIFEDCWIPLRAAVIESGLTEDHGLDKALSQYHEYAMRTRRAERKIDAHTLGRFIKRGVVIGGPGMGKSTLLKKLALEYSKDGFLVLLAKLPQVAALLSREGKRFEDCLWEVALSSSGLHSSSATLEGAVILCDGLDECGSQQSLVTDALHAFATAHNEARIIIASRPIGYQPGLLGEWRHYELQPLEEREAERAISKVLEAIPSLDATKRQVALELAKQQLKAQNIKGMAARSPLLLTLVAALVAKGIEPGTNRAALYRQLFRLIEDHPPTRLAANLPHEAERNRFLELLGWSLLAYGNEPFERTMERCAEWWSKEAESSSLTSQIKVQECFRYWESLGVLERVRTLTQEAVTFVHKTFGEFAAARHLCGCKSAEQRDHVAKAIRTPSWKEALSFASHLGLTTVVLDVWASLARTGDSTAAYRLDDAMELIVQSGIPIEHDVLDDFVECCWLVAGNTTSRTRLAAGDALCKVAYSKWSTIRDKVLARLNASDDWIRLVAFACACVSDEDEIEYPTMVDHLGRLPDLWPKASHLGGFRLSSGGGVVWESFVTLPLFLGHLDKRG